MCVAPNICNCTLSWSGYDCTTPRCNSICLNGGAIFIEKNFISTMFSCSILIGTCIGPNNCSCVTSAWTGTRCQTRMFFNYFSVTHSFSVVLFLKRYVIQHAKMVAHVLALIFVNVRNKFNLQIVYRIVIIEGATGYTGSLCQQRILNCIRIH
jgi:hypothetical protein